MTRYSDSVFLLVLMAAILNFKTNAGEVTIRTIVPPADCTGGFCTTKPEGYDELEVHINKKIKELNLTSMTMEDRWGPENHDLQHGGNIQNCFYTKKTIRPYMYRNSHTNEHVLIAQSDIFLQTIEETKCKYVEEENKLSANKECFTNELNTEISTRCETKYVQSMIYAFDIATGEIENISIDAAAWCYCHMEIDYNN